MCSFTNFCSVTLLPELVVNLVKLNVSWECIFRVKEDIRDVKNVWLPVSCADPSASLMLKCQTVMHVVIGE